MSVSAPCRSEPGARQPARPLRVAVIGLGVGEAHAAAAAQHAGCELAALCDVDAERLAAVSKRFPGVRATTNSDAVLDDPDIDVVTIASYDDAHAGQAVAAIERGKHVFVEKPLCLSAAEARRIHAALRRRPDVRLSSNLILRASPRFADLKRRVDAGELGELFQLDGDYLYGRLHKITEGWRGRIPYYSVVLGGAIHIVDLMLWLTGARVREVCAYGNQIVSRGSQFRFEDAVLALLRFDSGVIAKVGVSYGCVCPHFHPLRVYGSRATFINRPDEAEMIHSRDPARPVQRIRSAYPGVEKGTLLRGFLDAIAIGGRAPVEPDEVFEALAVCLAIERSLAARRAVEVEPL